MPRDGSITARSGMRDLPFRSILTLLFVLVITVNCVASLPVPAVVGIAANVFASGFPKNYIPSFSWGKETYRLERALETAKIVYGRRGKVFAEEDARIITAVYKETEANRERYNTN